MRRLSRQDARTRNTADLRAELLSFPAGKHDDQVDALGLVGQLLDKINAGQRPKPPDVAPPDAYRPAFEEIPGR
jgi:hypothetical protein